MLTGTAALTKLKEYAPIVVEGGTGRRDQRDPVEVARRVAAALRPRITERQAILVTQGDPLEATGISPGAEGAGKRILKDAPSSAGVSDTSAAAESIVLIVSLLALRRSGDGLGSFFNSIFK